MFLKTAREHVSWLYFPSRFLFGTRDSQRHRVPGWETVRFVASQPEVEAVTKATGEVFLGGAGNAFLGTLLGPQSVFLLDHERHQLARHIAGRALSAAAAPAYTDSFNRYIDEALDVARRRPLTAVASWSRALTMRAMCGVVLGLDDEATARRFFRRFEASTSYAANVVSYSKWLWHPGGPFSLGRLAAHVVSHIDRLLYETIADRKRRGATGDCPLDALIRGQEEHGYDDAFIRDNLVALIAAGYETTGSAIAWMLFWLAQSQPRARLRERHAAGDREYVAAFRSESLRYCPPVEILPRKVADEYREAAIGVLPDLVGPAVDGATPLVCPFIHRVHHDPAVHAQPERFDPERFIGRSYRRTEYLPFGLGRRFCLGAAVGQRLMDAVLERLLDRGLHFQLLQSSFRPIRRNVIIWPGIFLWARLRQDEQRGSKDA